MMKMNTIMMVMTMMLMVMVAVKLVVAAMLDAGGDSCLLHAYRFVRAGVLRESRDLNRRMLATRNLKKIHYLLVLVMKPPHMGLYGVGSSRLRGSTWNRSRPQRG